MAGYKKTPNAKPIINITISEELLTRVEDYHFSERMPNRSQAICELIKLGLEKVLEEVKAESENG